MDMPHFESVAAVTIWIWTLFKIMPYGEHFPIFIMAVQSDRSAFCGPTDDGVHHSIIEPLVTGRDVRIATTPI